MDRLLAMGLMSKGEESGDARLFVTEILRATRAMKRNQSTLRPRFHRHPTSPRNEVSKPSTWVDSVFEPFSPMRAEVTSKSCFSVVMERQRLMTRFCCPSCHRMEACGESLEREFDAWRRSRISLGDWRSWTRFSAAQYVVYSPA